MLNDLSLVQVGCHLCGEEWIFQQDYAAIHNASITKKYCFLLLNLLVKLNKLEEYNVPGVLNIWNYMYVSWLFLTCQAENFPVNSLHS